MWCSRGPRWSPTSSRSASHRKSFTGLGADVNLDLHIENGALRIAEKQDRAPDGLALIGVVRPPTHGARTKLSDARLALAMLDEHHRRALRSEDYLVQLPVRWRAALGIQEPVDDTSGEGARGAPGCSPRSTAT